jgi:hypothetical protein
MSDVQIDAFKFWFNSKYEVTELDDNQLAISLERDGQKIPTFIFFFDGLWSVVCPFMMLDKKSKKDLFELIDEHSGRSTFGLTLLGDMLCITNCSTIFNAADADEFINDFATHARALMN